MLRWKYVLADALINGRLAKGVRRKQRIRRAVSRSMAVESLEERRMLTTPTVSSITASDIVVTDSDVGASAFAITVVFDEDMTDDGSQDPVITFDPTISSSLTLASGTWPDSRTFMATYDLADGDVEAVGVDVMVDGAEAADGDPQAPGTETDVFSIDTQNPAVASVLPNKTTLSDSDVGADQYSLMITFTEEMIADGSTDPTITFVPDVAGTLTLSSGSWSVDNLTYTATYDVADANVDLEDIDINVADAEDVAENLQQPSTSINLLSIDTENPTVESVTPSDLLLSESDSGLDAFSITATFSEAMDTSGPAPTIAFDPSVASVLTLSSGDWSADATTYTATYHVGNVTTGIFDIDVMVSGGQDVVGNLQIGRNVVDVFDINVSAVIEGDQDLAGQDDEFRLILDAANPNLLRVFLNGAEHPTSPLQLDITPQINISGLGGNDTLIVDSSNGLISIDSGIRFEGGSGNDQVDIAQTGGPTLTSESLFVGAASGQGIHELTTASATQRIEFAGLEPFTTNAPAPSFTITSVPNLVSLLQDANQINYEQGTAALLGPNAGRVTVDSFEPIEFINKTTLVIVAGAGDDVVVANNANLPTGLTELAILGGDGNDTIRLENLPDASTTTFLGVAAAAGEGGDDIIDGSAITVPTPLALVGGAGDDTLIGGAGPDVLVGDFTFVSAAGGDDTLVDSPGDDMFDGGAGNDTLVIRGTTANDAIDLFQNAPSNVVGGMYTLGVTNLAATTVETINAVNPALAPDDAANLPSIERIRIESLAGDDMIRVGHADEYTDTDNTNGVAAQTIAIDVQAGPPNASDRLIVQDAGLGDLVQHHIGPGQRSGTVIVGGAAPIEYNDTEFVDIAGLDPLTGTTGTDNLGRLVVFKHDPFEANNSLPTATFLGAGPTINVDPTISPGGVALPFPVPGDADFYQFVAQETGTLDFQLYFEPVAMLANGNAGLPGDGELDATFFDNDGVPVAGIGGSTALNLLDGSGAKIGERITIPVVENQTYFVRIQGDSAEAINVYNFTAINVPAPIPELVDLQAASDSGRNDTDDITNNTTPTFNIVLDDDRIDAFANLNLLPDTNDDNAQTVGFDYGIQMFNNGAPIGFAFYTGVANTWQFTAVAGTLNEGDFNHISAAVWVRDRAVAATIDTFEMSPALQVTLDTIAPPISFGLPANATDGLFDGSDTGVATDPATFNDRITSDTTPTVWGLAEADSVVTLYLDTNQNGTIEPAVDLFLGQAVAVPLDGNNAFASGSWEITANTDLNSAEVLAAFALRDGARPLLVTAQDQAGNPLPVAGTIGPRVGGALVDSLTIFLDTQGPRVAAVSANAQPDTGGGSYDLFDPKPSVNGPSPLINSITINFVDVPSRVDAAGIANDFLYPALDPAIASNVGNYAVIGDSNGQVGIASVTVDQALKLSGTLTAVSDATNFSDAGLIGAAAQPAVGDFITFNSGATSGLWQRVTAFNAATGTITVDLAAGGGPAVGDSYSIVTAASLSHAVFPSFNTTAEETVTGSMSATSFFAANILGAAVTPLVGDYIRFNTGVASSGSLTNPVIRRVTAFDAATGLITLDSALPQMPIVGDGFSLIGGVNSGAFSFQLAPAFANTASVTLTFTAPLPDDRFTLTISDNLVDPANNKLDGETDADQPLEDPTLSGNGFSGDGIPGGDFVGRFTIDTRPEIAVWSAGIAAIDINGNLQYDPENIDASNRDINFQIGFASDNIFAGKFGVSSINPALASGFDTLAAYGRVGNQWRWMIDVDHDGVITAGTDIITNDVLNINGMPVAGEFDGNPLNGDEIGVFDGTTWYLDTNRSFTIDPADTTVASNYMGFPIVGDFNGDGLDDLGAYTAVTNQAGGNLVSIDTNRSGTFNTQFRVGFAGGAANGFNVFPGVRERAVAADMNADGIDDLGFWVPDGSALSPGDQGEWYFFVSPNASLIGRVNNNFLAYAPTPFGPDFSARFGNSFAWPIVGNFDPPVVAAAGLANSSFSTGSSTSSESESTEASTVVEQSTTDSPSIETFEPTGEESLAISDSEIAPADELTNSQLEPDETPAVTPLVSTEAEPTVKETAEEPATPQASAEPEQEITANEESLPVEPPSQSVNSTRRSRRDLSRRVGNTPQPAEPNTVEVPEVAATIVVVSPAEPVAQLDASVSENVASEISLPTQSNMRRPRQRQLSFETGTVVGSSKAELLVIEPHIAINTAENAPVEVVPKILETKVYTTAVVPSSRTIDAPTLQLSLRERRHARTAPAPQAVQELPVAVTQAVAADTPVVSQPIASEESIFVPSRSAPVEPVATLTQGRMSLRELRAAWSQQQVQVVSPETEQQIVDMVFEGTSRYHWMEPAELETYEAAETAQSAEDEAMSQLMSVFA